MTWVYFLLIDESHIKIGKADNLKRRIGQHAKTTLDRHDVQLLAAVKGSHSDEKHVQRYFADDCIPELSPINGNPPEVFIPSPRLTNYVRWLRNQWFTKVDIGDEPDGCTSAESWHPSEERQMPPAAHPLFSPDWLEFSIRIVTGDDYYTHSSVIERANLVMGGIDLDPASHPLANRQVKATKFYTIQDNGLDQKWGGRVWLNPPFSQWALWVPKIITECRSGRVNEICMYATSHSMNAKYFRPLLDTIKAMCIITGRLPHGGIGEGKSPDRGHSVLYVGQNTTSFVEAFSSIGSTWSNTNA